MDDRPLLYRLDVLVGKPGGDTFVEYLNPLDVAGLGEGTEEMTGTVHIRLRSAGGWMVVMGTLVEWAAKLGRVVD